MGQQDNFFRGQGSISDCTLGGLIIINIILVVICYVAIIIIIIIYEYQSLYFTSNEAL